MMVAIEQAGSTPPRLNPLPRDAFARLCSAGYIVTQVVA